MASQTKPDTKAAEELRQLLQVQPPSAVVEWMNIFVYGEAGVGKTYLIGTAEDDPRLHPCLIFDVEGGMTTLRKRQGIDVVPVRALMSNGKDALEDHYNRLYKHFIEHGSLPYKTIGIDSLTELADLDMRLVMKAAYGANPDKVDIDVPSPREWGKVRNHIRLIVRAFRDLPVHVVFTGGLGIIQKEGFPDKFVPGFAGKLQREVPGFADIVGYMQVSRVGDEIVRSLQVQGTNRVVAKDRTEVLGAQPGMPAGVFHNPTLPRIWDVIEGLPLADTPTDTNTEGEE